MLAITGMSFDALSKSIKDLNKSFRDGSSRAVSIGLVNGPDRHVVVGDPVSLHALYGVLDQLRPNGADQGRVPFSQRKPDFSMEYLKTTIPFHCDTLEGAIK